MQLLSLNCQKLHQKSLADFMTKTLDSGQYDFLLLQEADSAVLELVGSHPAYRIVVADDAKGSLSLVSIAYAHDRYRLVSHHQQLFDSKYSEPMDLPNHFHSYGVRFGVFASESGEVTVGSLHLPAGLQPHTRLTHLQEAKSVLEALPKNGPQVFGGDCNFALPGTLAAAERILQPEYVCVTKHTAPTLDSYYTEALPYLTNRIANLLRRFGIHIHFHTDNIFVDQATAATSTITSRTLPDRVSDHSPVEVIISE